MGNQIEVSWGPCSDFYTLVLKLTSRYASRWRSKHDPFESLFEVWLCLDRTFKEGEHVNQDEPLLRVIVSRKVFDYYNTPFIRSIRQPLLKIANRIDIEGAAASGGDAPDEIAADREFRNLLEAKIGAMRPRTAEAVRSLLEFPDGAGGVELARRWGSSRQYVSKLGRRGLAELKREFSRNS